MMMVVVRGKMHRGTLSNIYSFNCYVTLHENHLPKNTDHSNMKRTVQDLWFMCIFFFFKLDIYLLKEETSLT